MRNLLLALGWNLALLLPLLALWAIWNSRRPMTAGRLRRTLHWEKLPAQNALPCGGHLGAAAALLRAAGQGGDDRAWLAALLLRWTQAGCLTLRVAPKKKLRSFGEDEQAEVTFTDMPTGLTTAERGLFETLRGWADADGTLQRSELYQAARADAAALQNRMTQLRHEGVRALRELGGAYLEGKKTKFGFSRDEREIYTAKGVRLARGLAGFQKFARAQDSLTGEAAVFAVLTGASDAAGPQAALADVLAQAVLDGAAAGNQVSVDKNGRS